MQITGEDLLAAAVGMTDPSGKRLLGTDGDSSRLTLLDHVRVLWCGGGGGSACVAEQ